MGKEWGGLTSGQIIMVMIEAGTTIPPIPNPAIMSGAHVSSRLSTRAIARAPHPFYQGLLVKLSNSSIAMSSEVT